jgi:hypothetical protein
MIRIDRQGIVFAGAPGSKQQSATFPVPCVTADGRWGCVFRGAPAKGPLRDQRVLVSWSDDRGTTWSEPIAPFDAPRVNGRPGTLRTGAITDLGNGQLFATLCWVDASEPDAPFFNNETEGLLDTRIFVTAASDGTHWSPLRLVDTTPYNVPTPTTGPILRLLDGTLACQFELNKPYLDKKPWRHAAMMIFSHDQGATWNNPVVIAEDPEYRVYYWDQRPSVLPDGRLFNVFWTYDRQSGVYRNIHAAESLDNGKTWTVPWDTGVGGQPGPVFPLADGSLAMPVVDRSKGTTIKVCRSVDDGQTWVDGVVVHGSARGPSSASGSSMQTTWDEMVQFSVGLPSAAPLPDGGALLVYYAGAETDVTAIHWAEIR